MAASRNTGIRSLEPLVEPISAPAARSSGNPILDFALQQGWVDANGRVVGDSARSIYDAAKQYGITGTELDQAFGWDSGAANAYATSRGWDALQSPRDSLAAQLRAQYGGSGSGSGNWDDAGYDRAGELADLLLNAGVTNLGDLSFKDVIGERWEAGMDDQGNALPGQWIQDTPIGRQLMIGDKAVGYLGDYNNDGTFGNKADTVLGGVGDEALLGWSARGSGNTSYRVVTDPTTGKLVITPGWNSSSDAADFRKAGIFLAGSALGGQGISGGLASAAGLSGTAGGAALSGAATGAGLNMATTQDISQDTALAAAMGGIGGYLGHVGGDLISSLAPGSTGSEYLPGVFDTVENTVPLNMAAIESGLGTPGYGFNASAAASGLFDPAIIGSGASLMYGPGGEIIPYDPAAVSAITANDPVVQPDTPTRPTNTKPASEWTDAEWDEYLNSSDPALSAPTDAPTSPASVDVSGARIPAEVVNVGGIAGATLPTVTDVFTNPGNNEVVIEGERIPNEHVNVGGAVGATLPTAVDVFTDPGPQTVEITTEREPPYSNEGRNHPDVINTLDSEPFPPYTYTPLDPLEPIGTETYPVLDQPPFGPNLGLVPVTPLEPIGTETVTEIDPVPVVPPFTPPGGTTTPPGGGIDITDLIPLIPFIPGIVGGGGGTTTPGTPGTSITATPAAPLGRRYVAPPPGYRPGIDPEHRYFTGIGAVGIGG